VWLPQVAAQQLRRRTYYLAPGAQEQSLLAAVRYQLVHPACPASLLGQLQQIALSGVLNLQAITSAALDKHLLFEVLPDTWWVVSTPCKLRTAGGGGGGGPQLCAARVGALLWRGAGLRV
jgi:hypothetical protein